VDILKDDMAHIFRGADVVLHLAAITNAADSFGISEQVELVNYAGTEKVAQTCLKEGCPLIFFSTTSVYGTQKDIVDEACSLDDLKPQSPYAESKLRAELLLKSLGKTGGLQFFIGRLGTIFGTSPGMRFHTAVNKFCWQAILGKPITVWRTALHQYRPYLDLADAVAAVKFIIKRKLYDNHVYNILTCNATVNEIVQIITQHILDLSIQYVDKQIMNQLSYHVSNKRFSNLGFEFKGDLHKSIKETLDMFKGIRHEEKQC
jgi:UDP-glucose 4-epimerase